MIKIISCGHDVEDRPLYVTKGGIYLCDVGKPNGYTKFMTYRDNDPDDQPDLWLNEIIEIVEEFD